MHCDSCSVDKPRLVATGTGPFTAIKWLCPQCFKENFLNEDWRIRYEKGFLLDSKKQRELLD
jgi:hypothetical protein